MLQLWDAVILSRAEAHNVATVDLSRFFRNGMYGQHLGNLAVLDCGHSCFHRALFAPVWDSITRTLLRVAENKNHSLRQPPLALSIENVCPPRNKLFALIPADKNLTPAAIVLDVPIAQKSLDELFRSQLDLPQPDSAGNLKVSVNTSDLQDLQKSSFFWSLSTNNTASLNISVTSSVSGSFGFSAFVFLDVFYYDIQTQVKGEKNPRRGFESVFLEHVVLKPTHPGIASTALWQPRVAQWIRDGAAVGDSYSLRIFACEATPVPSPSGGTKPFCASHGEVGCFMTDVVSY
jgi:hypothetical protein